MNDCKKSMKKRILSVNPIEKNEDGDVGQKLRDDRQKRHSNVDGVASLSSL